MSTTTSPLVAATNHAKLRWFQRGSPSKVSALQAWSEGYDVDYESRRGSVRIHPPTSTLLIAEGGEIVTILQAEYANYQAEHLIKCSECSLQYHPGQDGQECPWCQNCGDKND